MKKEDVQGKKLNNKGFSLVEIIIVIAIMAILAGALAPQLMKYVGKSRKSADIQVAQTIATAANVALTEENVTPTSTRLSACYTENGDFQKEIKKILGGTQGAKPKTNGYKDFLIIYDSAKGIEIYATTETTGIPTPTPGDQLYPSVGSSFNQ